MSDLEGILVVTLEQAVAAPYASSLLAEAGARVIKVERKEGDFARHYDHVVKGESAYFVWLNRGKESVCLNLKSADDRTLLSRMLEKADVFIQNLKPGSVQKLGLGYDELRSRNPGLVMCSISGYGERGEYSNLKAYDLLVQAESGLSTVTGNEQGSARVGFSVCDIGTGMTAYSAILRGLLARSIRGRGTHIELSLFGVMTDWMNVPLLHQQYGGEPPERLGMKHPSIAPYGVFRTAGGGQVVISVQNEREWVVFCERVLCAPELASDARYSSNVERVANRPELDDYINETLSSVSLEEVCDRLQTAQIAYGRLNELSAVLSHPQLRKVTVDSPVGAITMVASGVSFDRESVPSLAVPALGQHSAAIRAEFGGE
jgi:crotonobetainyl-CoA:carnitine CoA-transferase CaiB-like acyl-CoA transferase